jgi:long-chain acyl-CoA synthetase
VDKLTGCKRAIFNAAYNSKLHTYNNDEGYTHKFYDSVIFKKIRESLGGKLRMVLTAGAYLDPEVHKSVSIYLSVSFLTIYGLIETCTSCFITKMADLSTSHCGGPMSNT